MSYLSQVTAGLLGAGFSTDDVQKITDVITIVSHDYEITPRETALVTFNDADNVAMIKLFAATKTLEGKSEKTVSAYVRELKRFSWAVKKDLKGVKPNDIRFYLALMQQRGCKNQTVENTRAYLSSFFKWAADEDIIAKSPCSPVKPIKVKDEIRLPFSETDLDKLRASCENEKERALIEFLLATGARVNEVASMNVTDVSFADLTVHIREGKGGKERMAHMDEVAAMHLKNYLLNRKTESNSLFANRDGKANTTGGIRSILYKIGERAGVEDVHPHRFRRTLATTLSRRGMPVEKIQLLLGHSSIDTTMKYIHVNEKSVAAAYHQCA